MALTSSYQYIGRSNAVGCPAGWKYYILIYAKTSGNVSTGKHTVSVKMRLACDADSSFYGWNTTGYATVGGSNAFSWNRTTIPGSAWNFDDITAGDYTYRAWVDLKEGSVEVDVGHGVTKNVTIESSWVMNSSGNGDNWFPYKGTYATTSHTVTLPMIAGASAPTVSASSVVMKNAVTIYTNRLSSAFTHDLTYSFNGHSGTIATGVGDSYSWTVPDLASKISGSTSGTCTITCTTKSGSTVIGSKTVTLTLTVPAKSSPTVSASTVQMGKSVTIYTNRNSTGFTHTVTYAIGTASGTISTGVESSASWTPSTDLAYYTGNKTSATCTITCSTYNGSALVGTSTTTITLTVPDASVPSVSASTLALGSNITISITKYADAFTHDLAYTLKASGSTTVAASGTIATGVSSPYLWPVPLTLAAKIPGATSGTITITCTTRFPNTSSVVGSNTVSFTVTVPNNSTTQPKVTMSLSPVSDLPSTFSGIYVAGKSKVKVSYSASSDYSSIASYQTSVNGENGSTNPYTSSLLSKDGTVSITGRVTDARGYFTTQTPTIEVIPYSRPRIVPGEGQSNIVCTRCNSDWTVDPGGVHLMIKAGRKYSPVVSGGSKKNYCRLSYRYKTDAQDDSEYSPAVTLLEGNASSNYVSVILSGIVSSNTTAYNIQIIVEDDIGESDTVTITVPTAFATFHAPAGGHGFTLGGYHDPAKYDVFDCRFDAEFQGNVSGRVLGLGKLPEIPGYSDANTYKDFGAWSVRTDAIAATIANLPSAKKGTFRVWSADGSGETTGNYIYLMQEYICFDNSASYRRSIKLEGADSAWEYGPWK